jgi:heptosyltransferase-3
VYVNPDGGAMHFSTAVGTPTMGLFGKTDPNHWGPWGDGHVALRKGKQADLISVEHVYQVLVKLLKSQKPDEANRI